MATYIPLGPLPFQFQDAVTSANMSGGTIEFYLAGTATATNLYSDNIGTSIGSSITLNSGGMPASGGNVITLFRDDTIALKLVLKDADGATVSTSDTIPAATSLRATPFYDTSAAETAAGVTIVDYSYPPLNVLRYGTNTTPGTTDMSTAIQAAWNVAMQAGGTIFVPAGKYRCLSRLKFQNSYSDSIFIQVKGEGRGNPFLTGAANNSGSLIISDSGGIAIDCAGCSNFTMEDIGIFSGASNPATIGILFQRTTNDPYAQLVALTRVSIGMTSDATANGSVGSIGIMNKRGEHHHYKGCWFYADRPHIADGNSFYSSILSPDYSENAFAGASLTFGQFDSCGWLSSAGYGVELITTGEQTFTNGYWLIEDGSCGINVRSSSISTTIISAACEIGSGTPLAFLRVAGSSVNVVLDVNNHNITNMTAVRLASGAYIRGATLSIQGVFLKAIDISTESGGPVFGTRIIYDTGAGHTMPESGLYGCQLNDISSSSNPGMLEIRGWHGVNNMTWQTGNLTPSAAATGTDMASVSTTECYFAEVFVAETKLLTGISLLCGTVAAGNIQLALADGLGTVVAQTASTANATTSAYKQVAFTATYLAKGPARYFVMLQCNNASNQFRAHAIGNFNAGKQTGQSYGTFTTLTIPESFTADLGPIASLY